MLILQNILFFNFLYFIGRGFFILLNTFVLKKDYKSFFGLKKELYYVLFSIFIIGNLSFLLNFFIPLQNNIILFLVSIFLIFNFQKRVYIKAKKDIIIQNILLPGILGFSSYDIGFHYDAGLYHLNNQNWIVNEKIIFGLSNIYPPFGFSSLNEYILSSFWIGNNFMYLHFLNLAFLSLFFAFLYNFIFVSEIKFYKYGAIFVILYGFLDNFGLNGGRNGFLSIQGVGKVDNNFSIIFVLSSIFCLYIIKSKDITKTDFIIINFFVLFLIQLKVYGVIIIFLYLFIFFRFIKEQKFLILFKSTIFPLFIGVLWLLKNVSISGCFFYPVKITCFKNFSWYSKDIDKLIIDTRDFHNAYNIEKNFFGWFRDFFIDGKYAYIYQNYLISFLIILFLYKFLFTTKNKKGVDSLFLSFIVLSTFTYIFTSPAPRFTSGLMIFSVFYLGSKVQNLNIVDSNKYIGLLFSFIFFSTLVFTPRLEAYFTGLVSLNSNKVLEVPIIDYKKSNGWGVNPSYGDQCWINLECTNKNIKLKSKNISGYKFLIREINR
tara:strand:+ start:212 stop:1846 length:1635 start_codon:yes stop_codon:yes gene_type:complete